MQKQGGSLGMMASWAMASDYFPFGHQNLFWYGCQVAKEVALFGVCEICIN